MKITSKKTIQNTAVLVLFVPFIIACGARGPSGQNKCEAALIATQKLKGQSVQSAQQNLQNSPSMRGVPVIYGQTAIANGTAQRGTLVMEVNQPLGTPVEEMLQTPITNIYCFN